MRACVRGRMRVRAGVVCTRAPAIPTSTWTVRTARAHRRCALVTARKRAHSLDDGTHAITTARHVPVARHVTCRVTRSSCHERIDQMLFCQRRPQVSRAPYLHPLLAEVQRHRRQLRHPPRQPPDCRPRPRPQPRPARPVRPRRRGGLPAGPAGLDGEVECLETGGRLRGERS